MTATVEAVLALDNHEIGYHETGGADGLSGNVTRYWSDLIRAGRAARSLQGQPWCAAFGHWVDWKIGAPLLPISNPYYCQSVATYAKEHGLWVSARNLTPGDYVLMDFKGAGLAEHFGRLHSIDVSAGICHNVEGNTVKPGGTGSQREGGGVYARERSFGVVLGGLDYSRYLHHVATTGTAPRRPVKSNPWAHAAAVCKRGDRGDKVRFVQWAVGVDTDGDFGGITQRAAALFQHQHGIAPATGGVGVRTLLALRHVTR